MLLNITTDLTNDQNIFLNNYVICHSKFPCSNAQVHVIRPLFQTRTIFSLQGLVLLAVNVLKTSKQRMIYSPDDCTCETTPNRKLLTGGGVQKKAFK